MMSAKQLYASKKKRVKFEQKMQVRELRQYGVPTLVPTPHPKNPNSLYAKLSTAKYQSPLPRFQFTKTNNERDSSAHFQGHHSQNALKHEDVEAKPIYKKAKKIHDNDPYNKGELLTYYCHVCGVDHMFHKGDVIVGDGNHYYSSEESEMASGESLYTQQDLTKPSWSATQSSDASSEYNSPDITLLHRAPLCCAESFCANPTRLTALTATITCDDCMNDFHQNTCGKVIEFMDYESGTTVNRNVCYKCYNLCCCGRDMCKHPGDHDGLIMCKVCRKYFHSSGCGGETVVMRLSRKTEIYSPTHLCYICVNNIYGYDTPDRKKLELEDAAKPVRKNQKC
jgi:hypothetical protein